MRARCLGLLTAVCLAAFAGGCGSDEPELRITPGVLTPGGELQVALSAPNHDAMTESTATLEKSRGGTWQPVYVLTSDAVRGPHALPIPPGGPTPTTFGVGLDEDAVQVLKLPGDLPPGQYRIVKSVSDLAADRQFDLSREFDVHADPRS